MKLAELPITFDEYVTASREVMAEEVACCGVPTTALAKLQYDFEALQSRFPVYHELTIRSVWAGEVLSAISEFDWENHWVTLQDVADATTLLTPDDVFVSEDEVLDVVRVLCHNGYACRNLNDGTFTVFV